MNRLWTLARQVLLEQKRNIIVWGVSMGLLGMVYVLLYPAFEGALNDYLKEFPKVYLEALGISAGISDAAGFLNMELFNMLAPLALPFFTILVGSRAVAGTEERKTLDMLLSNPVPRWQLVVSRYLAMAIGLAMVLVLFAVLTWVAAPLRGVDLSFLAVARGAANLWPFCMFFGALALFLSALLRRGAAVSGIAAAVLIAMYVANAMAGVVDSIRQIRYGSLFYYYGTAILEGIDWLAFVSIVAVSLALTAAAVLAFERRDIYT